VITCTVDKSVLNKFGKHRDSHTRLYVIYGAENLSVNELVIFDCTEERRELVSLQRS
jgi:hypothetical protein